jgi:hypothetical protein
VGGSSGGPVGSAIEDAVDAVTDAVPGLTEPNEMTVSHEPIPMPQNRSVEPPNISVQPPIIDQPNQSLPPEKPNQSLPPEEPNQSLPPEEPNQSLRRRASRRWTSWCLGWQGTLRPG